MISAGRLTPGHAAYFEGEVAKGREDYYAGRGESPGVWTGTGAAAAGLDGEVLEGQLQALFEMRHPVSGEALGADYNVSATYVDRFGNEQARHKRAAIDATWSAPKSVSELAFQGDAELEATVRAAMQAGVDASIAYLDEHAAFSRAGKGGVRQVDTEGLMIAQYDHRTSRAGDPQLHAHLLISNRVHCGDGTWRALDGRALFPELKTAGMIGQAVMRAELDGRGIEWGEINEHGQAEIVGVPAGLMELHSKRSKAVEVLAAAAIARSEDELQRSLTPSERAQKYDAAAVETRAVKSRELHAIAGLRDRWRAEAIDAGYDPANWLPDTLNRSPRQQQQNHPTRNNEQIIEAALATLTEQKSSWGRSEAVREIARLTPHHDTTGDAVFERIGSLTGQLLESEHVVQLTIGADPAGPVRASDGRPEYETHHAAKFTTITTLEREQRVVDHVENGRHAGLAIVHEPHVADAINDRAAAGHPLSDDQAAAVERVTRSGEAVVALVGPAGSGKSATIGAAADAFERDGVPVRGLAVSAKAAEVLRTESGIENSDTVAKLLHENTKTGEPPASGYELALGEVLVVDEASMVSSADFARLVELAAAHEAKIVAVGDYRQLGAVNAGGLYRLIAADDGAELDQVWRFNEPWEQTASLQLRDGNTATINTYVEHDRVHGGTHEETLDTAFAGWQDARSRGESVIVTATDRTSVAEFNARARHHLQRDGRIADRGLVVGDIEVGAGDEVLTLRNDRRLLTTTGSFVRNGDRWQIQGHTHDGGLRLDGLGGQGQITLPAEYLDAGHLDYAYATTVHKAQGVTVDRAWTIVDDVTTAESLYVGATRGRTSNQMLAVCEAEHSEFNLETAPAPAATEVLVAAMGRETAEKSATEIIREQLDHPDAADHIDRPIEPPSLQQELAPAELQALISERHEINMDLREAEAKVFSNDSAQRRIAAELSELSASRDIDLSRIRYLDERLEAIADKNPVGRFRDRDNTTSLQADRDRRAENVADLDGQIGALQAEANFRQRGLAGYGRDDRHLDQAQERSATRGAEIDGILSNDINSRKQRLAAPEYVDAIEQAIGTRPEDPHVDPWLTSAAHIDQYRTAWSDGPPAPDSPERSTFEQHTRNVQNRQHASQQAIEPPELGLGISR